MSKILVIEDEPDQSRLIKLRLEARGYRVLTVGKAKEGLELAKREKPSLILMDMILPDMHGLDAAIKLREAPETRATPIIGLSAVGSPDFIKTCLQEGIAAYVRKPYDPRELFRIIEKFAKPSEHEKPVEVAETIPAAPRPQRALKIPGVPSPAAVPTTSGPAQPRDEAPSYAAKLDEIVSELKKTKSEAAPRKPAPKGNGRRDDGRIDDLIQDVLGRLAAPAPVPEAAPTAASRGIYPPSHILIVDDDAAFVRAVSGHLSERGYDISLAIDGVRAIRQVFAKKPDLILLNLILPGGGESVLGNLRKSPETRGIPVFIMSAMLSAKMLEEKARELGAQGFISKPIEPEDLLYIIESVVGA